MLLRNLLLLIRPFFNLGALLLIVPAAYVLHRIDESMFMTVIQWLLVAPILAGITHIIVRLLFPTISVTWLLNEIQSHNHAAGKLAQGLVQLVGMVFIGVVLWART